MPVNFLEIFFIGFGLGLTGPCLFYCVPLIFAFTLGNGKEYKESIIDILVFLSARFLAYIILAILAAVSGVVLRKLTGSALVFYSKPLAGIISIGLGLFILLNRRPQESGYCLHHKKIPAWGGLFGLGFIIGISPCAPLIALLSEIALLSNSVLDGVAYGAAFGLGTFIPAFIITAGLSGLFKQIPQRLFKSPRTSLFLRIISSVMLIFFGLVLTAGLFKR